MTNQDIVNAFDAVFPDVAIQPNMALVMELRELGVATLELLEDRSSSSVYRIRDNDVVYQIECEEGEFWSYESYEEYLEQEPIDSLLISFATPPKTYVITRDGNEIYITRTKSPRFKARYTPGGNNSDLEIMEFTDPVQSHTQAANIMRQASGQIAKYLRRQEK